jgi:cyclic pyranopterin phosphate synthase
MIDESRAMLGGLKLVKHLDRVAEWAAGGTPPPVTVEIDLTNLCNHSCGGCNYSHTVNIDKSHIPHDLALRIVRELCDFGVRGLTFSGGGEPLLHGEARLLELMAAARSKGVDVALITNGSLLRDPGFLDLCTWLRVSQDAYDPETFRLFHGGGAKEFAKVVANTAAMAGAAKARKDAGRYCSTFGVGFLTDRQSCGRRDFWRMAKFCAETFPGLDYLQFRPLVASMVEDPTLHGGRYRGFTAGEAGEVMDQYEEAAVAFGRPDFKVLCSADKYVSLAEPDFGRAYDRCHGHFLEAVVAADARVYLCCHTQMQERFCLGDLREQSFADVWRGERARRVVESFDPRTTCQPACRLHPQNSLLHGWLKPQTHENFI